MRLNLRKMSLKRLQQLVQEHGPGLYADVIAALERDPRGGAQRLVAHCRARLQEWEQQQSLLNRMYSYERQVWAMGHRLVAGLGEAGRGPLAGPVVAAAVILNDELDLPGINGGRRMTARRRDECFERIREAAAAIGIGMEQPDGIDEASVLLATHKAMVKAVQGLNPMADYLLVDSLHVPGIGLPQATIVGGDAVSATIAAASVVAKVTRDRYMEEMDSRYPVYGFAKHKGYGTAEHRAALDKYGPCPIHRKMNPGNRTARLVSGPLQVKS